MRVADYCIMGAILALALGFVLTATPQTGLTIGTDIVGSDGYPKILTALFAICFAAMAGNALYEKRKNGAAPKCKPVFSKEAVISVLAVNAMILLYIIGFTQVGFLTSTVVFVAVMFLYLESWSGKKALKAIVYGVLLAAVCKFAFDAFNIFLPVTVFP